LSGVAVTVMRTGTFVAGALSCACKQSMPVNTTARTVSDLRMVLHLGFWFAIFVLLLPRGAETDRAIRLSEIGTLNQKCASIL